MQIRGFQQTSVLDYPGEVCSTIFVSRCNLRCRYCFNSSLVLQPEALPLFPEEEIFSFLEKRIPVQGAICITGGEPAMQEDLAAFIYRAKRMGLKVKLDTNGTFPEILENLLRDEVLDYVAVDIKAPPDKYNLLTGINVDFSKIEQTVFLLKNSQIKYEFRTTVVPTFLGETDLVNIAMFLQGSRQYVLQQFRPGPTIIDKNLRELKPVLRKDMETVASRCSTFVKTILRGF